MSICKFDCMYLKRHRVILLFFIPCMLACMEIKAGNDLDSLDYYLSQKDKFDENKETRIQEIKNKIRSDRSDLETLYSLYDNLYNEYRSYIYDSAYVYVVKLNEVALLLDDRDKVSASLIKKGFCYLSSGLFKECFDLFSFLDVADCSDEIKVDYYATKARLYYDVADYDDNEEFTLQYHAGGNDIIDSAIKLLPVESPRFWACLALKRMKSDNYRGALDAFQKMILLRDYTEHDYAIATSSIAYLYTLQGKSDKAKEYLIKAAVSDIKSSTKETVALRNLAQILYEEGDVTRAATYIRVALDDAYFYNARHRQLEISQILPIIEKERTNMVEKQKNRIANFMLFVSILLVVLLIALFVIRKQLLDLRKAKKMIQTTNEHLTEADKIKEEYIGYFFSLNSEFIKKMEKFQDFVKKKVSEKKYDELTSIPRNLNPQREREALFVRFDQIFLKIFPNFVEKFNDLLKPEEQIQLKEGELLNTDLRIYALIRLGINDNDKIAQFLDYSVNTIYTYKTKIKNKAKYSNEDFKKKVMEIR